MLKGHLVFQDYAAAQWFFHLREIATHADTMRASDGESSETTNDLVTALREFLEMYEEALCEETILESSRQRCETIRDSPLSDAYGVYLTLFDHSERHLRKSYDERNAISIPQLGTALFRNREMLETWTKERQTVELAKTTQEMYGDRWFKCSKATCAWFHEGFKDARARDNHIKAHELPFRCEKPDCLYADMGFKTNKELEKHVKNFHPSREDAAMTFQAVKAPPAKTPHACHLCSKRFTRGFHLRSHLRVHNGERPYACAECGAAFTRDNDRKRHEDTVHARKR
jgi:hypothetical protein